MQGSFDIIVTLDIMRIIPVMIKQNSEKRNKKCLFFHIYKFYHWIQVNKIELPPYVTFLVDWWHKE